MPYPPREIQKGERVRRLILALWELWQTLRALIQKRKRGRLP